MTQIPQLRKVAEADFPTRFGHFRIFGFSNGSEEGERLRESIRQKPSDSMTVSPRIAAAEKFKRAADAALLQMLSDGKTRKPN